MGKWTDAALKIRPLYQKGAQSLSDDEALEIKGIYPEWEAGVDYTSRKKVIDNGTLYRCTQAHTSQADWRPSATPALWTALDETHNGTITDPIPAVMGMLYKKDLYYSEGDKLYLCIRQDTPEGTTLYYLPSQLVGSYFEEVLK